MARAAGSAEALAFGWETLPKVSRSFALVTRYLAADPRTRLGDAVMVFYLVCRVLDTVEDSALPAGEKHDLFEAFLAFLDTGAGGVLFPDPARLTPHAGYAELLRGTGRVQEAYRTLDPAARAVIASRAREMADGMLAFAGRPIVTVADLEAYCHPVAIVVGYGLTELFCHYGHVPAGGGATLPRARHFGLTLQKVNITRDYGQDHGEGRTFWPSALLAAHGLDRDSVVARRHEPAALAALAAMIDGIRVDADEALAYLLAVPPAERHLRLFCGVSLMLALLTLGRIRGRPEVFDPEAARRGDPVLKVSRAELQVLLARLEDVIGDDGQLRAAYAAARTQAFP